MSQKEAIPLHRPGEPVIVPKEATHDSSTRRETKLAYRESSVFKVRCLRTTQSSDELGGCASMFNVASPRASPLKSSPRRTGNDFHGSLLDGRACILLGDLAFQTSGYFSSVASSPPSSSSSSTDFYLLLNRTHESLFIEVLKIRRAVNGIEIGEIFVFIGGEVLKRNLILISDSFSFSLSLSLFKENLETDGINNFQLNATRRLISFKHFTRSSNE